jgi:protein-S-isoprenylcysteine O-methyltransferase Ste14
LKTLKQNSHIYLATLFTLAVMVLTQVINSRTYPLARDLALVIGIISLCLMFWPMFTLQRQGLVQPEEDYMQASLLVEGGLFAFVRHPQYLGYMCLNVTFMLIAQHWLILFLGFMAMALFYLYGLQEEKRLLEKFGTDYQAFMFRVPRFNILLGVIRWFRRRR